MEKYVAEARNALVIFGFACAQCFLYTVLFIGIPLSYAFRAPARFDLLSVLVFLAAAFLLVWLSKSGLRDHLFSAPSSGCAPFLPLIGLGLHAFGFSANEPPMLWSRCSSRALSWVFPQA